jgi:hypothetical protein
MLHFNWRSTNPYFGVGRTVRGILAWEPAK